jgi:membrane protein YqaA with SNARE-associated domain
LSVWRPPSLRRLRKLRLTHRWRAFVIALAVYAVLGTAVMLFATDLAGLFLLGLYNIPANSVIPVPHEPGILYFAKFYDPVEIAIAATMGSVIVSFADYALIEAAMRHPRVKGASEARLFRWAVRWMTRWPFFIIVVFSMIPILPVAVVRALAPASGYPLKRYIAAQVVGRFPRFLMLAWVGQQIMIPTWILVVFTLALLVLMYVTSSPAPEDDEDDPEAEEILVPDLSDPEHPIDPSESTRLKAASSSTSLRAAQG